MGSERLTRNYFNQQRRCLGRQSCSELATVDDDAGLGGLATLGGDILKGSEDSHGCWSDLAENGVLTIEMGEGSEAHEELGSVSVGASVSHGEDAGADVLVGEVLIGELHAIDGFATGTVSGGEITTLGHEASDDSVEGATLVAEGLAGLANTLLTSTESSEVLGALGSISVEIDLNATSGCTTDGDVEED